MLDVPSRLADRLAEGELDVPDPVDRVLSQSGLYDRFRRVHRLPRSGVERKLFSRKPVAQIRTLALDEGSRTSAALVRILLKERFALVPNVEALPIGRRSATRQPTRCC